ncbi:MAG: anti-phage deoxyguanosine triphosphatase [Candidatus Symbiodolus clandestinus]
MNDLWSCRRSSKQPYRRDDWRSPFQRDYSRILHSAALRRLQGKTQVFGAGQHDFYRTRLTHSLEVAQIGVGLVNQLQHHYPHQATRLPEPRLIESLALAHDIGHPPFGHGGEIALNSVMQPYGGFETNAQSLRIVTRLEPYTDLWGMNLTRRTLLGLLKYPRLQPLTLSTVDQLASQHWHKPLKALYTEEADWFTWIIAPLSLQDQQQLLKTAEQQLYCPIISLDCALLSLADDIAYGIHDLEDGIELGVLTANQWQSFQPILKQCADTWLIQKLPLLTQQLFSGKPSQRKQAIGTLVNRLISDAQLQPLEPAFDSPLFSFTVTLSAPMAAVLTEFKRIVDHFIIQDTRVQRLEYKGQQLIKQLFYALESDSERLLPEHSRQRWRQANEQQGNPHRVIADYIAGMTDNFAQQLYQQLLMPATLGSSPW